MDYVLGKCGGNFKSVWPINMFLSYGNERGQLFIVKARLFKWQVF